MYTKIELYHFLYLPRTTKTEFYHFLYLPHTTKTHKTLRADRLTDRHVATLLRQ